ncbi:uncharacterized protein I303_103675 [Kwoniella dejecticola CBS 10117]|uniref:Phospholipid/glycerol acyltransferase domain-containing protein n=1 Tax=Kwoniella dejecticola CBS 10117 TaxID=1296121 RepID=A0AAJ8KPA3_9TREE
MSEKPLYTIPIDQRPPHGPWTSKVFFPLVFNFAQLGINSAQFLFVPLLLIPVVGRRWFDAAVGWTKDGYGRLHGQMTKINLPDRLVVMANHQAYLDWMYLWILSCYAGHSRGIIILLKASLKKIPVIGWGMVTLTQLGHQARSGQEDHASETSGLLWPKKRSPLWLLIFPEGTIVSDEERVKSVRYAEREGVADFVTMLHPRSTGLLFCLRTLLPQVPDLQLLDVTIGYPGVPYGKYPQDWYGLFSVFFRSVPPPTVHIHLHLYSNLTSSTSEVPSLVSKPLAAGNDQPPSDTGLASPEETRAFELWLRGIWTAKEKRMERFYRDGRFESGEGGAREVVPRSKWYHWISAFGGGGMGTAAVVGVGIWQIAELLKSS